MVKSKIAFWDAKRYFDEPPNGLNREVDLNVRKSLDEMENLNISSGLFKEGLSNIFGSEF